MINTMKPTTILPLVLLLFVFSVGSNSHSQVAQTCAAGSHLAQFGFTVVNESGDVPADLTKDDLVLKTNNDLTTVTALDRQVGMPIDLAILIDVSVSQDECLAITKPVARALIQEVLKSADNRVALLSFSSRIEIEQPLTNDVTKALAALDAVKIVVPPGYVGGGVVISRVPPRGPSFIGATSLWDTSAEGLEKIYDSARDAKRRRAAILLSDGEDTSSKGKINKSIAGAIDRDVVIYAIGVTGGDSTLDRNALKQVSDQTGGTAAFPKNREELKTALLEISKRLGSQYIVSFCHAGDGPFKIRLDLNNPKLSKSRIAYPREH